MSRRAIVVALAAAAAVLLAVALVRGRGEPPTEEERIRALLDRTAKAAEEKRVGDAIEGLSERFRGGGSIDRQGAKQLVAFHVLRGEWVSVQVAGARIRVDGARARASVDAVLSRGAAKGKALAALLPGEASAHRFECALEQEDGEWRIVEAAWRPIDLADALAGPPEPAAPRP